MNSTDDIIRQYYMDNPGSSLNLAILSERLKMSKPDICARAATMGLTNRKRKKRIVLRGPNSPKWKGDDVKYQDSGRKRARKLYTLPSVCDRCGISPAVDRHHKDKNPLNNSPTNIAFLCSKCHSWEDGRSARLASLPRPTLPPRPCRNCAALVTRLWRGICHACNEYSRRNGGAMRDINRRCKCGSALSNPHSKRCSSCQLIHRRKLHAITERERRKRKSSL